MHKIYTMVYTNYPHTMKTAKLFKNGRSLAVRIPQEFRIEGTEVYIKKINGVLMLVPKTSVWESFLDGLSGFSPDFMENRTQPELKSIKM
jgi:antitoxin VapB